MSENIQTLITDLCETLAKIKSPEEIKNLLDDLCTYNEINSMAQRLFAAKLLIDGETYEQIIQKTDISSATLSRVNRCVKFGKGYSAIYKK